MKIKTLLTIVIAIFLFACVKTNPNLVTITGKITNPIGNSVIFAGSDTSFKTTSNEDGIFEITFSLDSAKYLKFKHGTEITSMYVKPGDNIYLTIDTEQFDESIEYKGSPASSFLAKKFLLDEEKDFFGEVYYLNNKEEYQLILDEFRMLLINELYKLNDSLFLNREIQNIDQKFDYYILNHDRIAGYDKDARIYLMKKNDIEYNFNFYSNLYSLSTVEFNNMLNDYTAKLNALLENVNDENYKKGEKELIKYTTNNWREKKAAYENVPKKGEPAVDFTYPDKDGNEISLSSLKGSLVYVDVWASWCGPCMGEIPALKVLEEEYHGKSIKFLSVSVDKNKNDWLKVLERENLGGIQLWAGRGSDISNNYAIIIIPRFMLFSAEGNVISTNAPRPSSNEIRSLLDSNL